MVETQIARSVRFPSPSLQLANGEITLHEIHQRFAQTEFGQRLQRSVRFERFKPDHVSNDAWQRLLGLDVNNYDHMHITEQLAQHFLQNCRKDPFFQGKEPQFTEDDEKYISLTARTHDDIEGFAGFRDISFDLKTAQDEKDELATMTVFMQQAPVLLSDDPEDQAVLRQHLLKVPEILGDKTGVLGQAFNAIERLGYMRTGIRAWQVSQHIPDDVTAAHLQWLASNVLGNQTDTLVTYAAKFYGVKEFLRERNQGITEAFDTMPSSVFLYYGDSQQAQRDKFMNAKNRWHRESCHKGNGIFPEEEKKVKAEEVVYAKA